MKYFGTDGIRGVVGGEMTSNLAYNIGYAIGKIIIDYGYSKSVIIGKDTRLSGDLLTFSLCAGLMDMGIDCKLIGIVPTACVSYLTKVNESPFGVMITASHNTFNMNGIKVFNKYGYKCTLIEEQMIENNMDLKPYILNKNKGRIILSDNLVEDYINHILSTFPLNLSNLNIALDMANGSNYFLAPKILKMLGANIITIGDKPNGKQINEGCGAGCIDALRNEVISHSCDIGFAFDGDADRLRVVTHKGTVLDGDDLIYIFARYLKKNNKLYKNTCVGTIMSNMGLEYALAKCDINFLRVDVGDKNVINKCVEEGFILGGEPSGHIVNLNYNTTCDALMNALNLLQIINNGDESFELIENLFPKYPSYQTSIKVKDNFRSLYKNDAKFVNKIQNIVKKYENIARVILRPSGTEPIFRLYVEGSSEEKCNKILKDIVAKINKINDLM